MGNLAVTTVAPQLDILASRRREIAQALPRPATVRLSVHTRGLGETYLKGTAAVSFGVLLLEEPSFAYGVISDAADLPKLAVPLATAVVTSWVTSSAGLYLGAEMAFCVFLPLLTPEESQKMTHLALKFSLIFEGVAMRSTAAANIPPAKNIPTSTDSKPATRRPPLPR